MTGIFAPERLSGFSRHLMVLQALSEKSVTVYRRKVEELAAWCATEGITKGISRQDIEQYLEHCFYQGNSNETRLTKLVAVRKYFRYLLYEGVIQKDPTDEIPKPKIRKKFVQKFTKIEILKIFAAVDINNEMGLRDTVIFIMAALCGLRVGEIVEITLQDIIDVGKSFDIHVVGKFDKERQVYLWKIPSDLVRELLTIRLTHGAKAPDPLFVSYARGGKKLRGRKLTAARIDAITKRYAHLAGVRKPKISTHMFRATHASDLRSIRGYDTPAIAERLGHERIETTDRYIPTRGRIHTIYPSLAVYWKDLHEIWKNRREGHAGNTNYGWEGNAEI